MRIALLAFLPVIIVAAEPGEAMPFSTHSEMPLRLVMPIAEGCGPGLVHGLGICLKRRAIFSHGRLLQKGCGKPIGAGLRTPC